jgi:hypothetical protein
MNSFVLLLSARPEAHRILMDSLCHRGVDVRVPRRPDRALPLLRDEPSLVLVDLVYGAALTPSLVALLNRRHGGTHVVALHRGNWGREPLSAELSVDGFCPASDADGLVDALVTTRVETKAPH